MRLDLILAASPAFRASGAVLRLNTNGHGSLIHGRDILPELGRVIDRVNLSLNAPTCERYIELCRPDPSSVPGEPEPEAFWRAVIDFLERARVHFGEVQASVVGHVLTDDEIASCRRLAGEIAAAPLRVR
jgi:TatD DNase family protein